MKKNYTKPEVIKTTYAAGDTGCNDLWPIAHGTLEHNLRTVDSFFDILTIFNFLCLA